MNTKLANVLLIILLIFNIGFLGTWWMGHHKVHHSHKEMKPETTMLLNDRDKGEIFLVKALGLDSLQQQKLDTIMKAHFHFMDKYMGAYMRNQNNIFNSVKESKDSAYAFRCADSLGMLKVTMEKELYIHLNNIRNICNQNQQRQFDTLIVNGVSREFVHRHDFHQKPNHDSL